MRCHFPVIPQETGSTTGFTNWNRLIKMEFKNVQLAWIFMTVVFYSPNDITGMLGKIQISGPFAWKFCWLIWGRTGKLWFNKCPKWSTQSQYFGNTDTMQLPFDLFSYTLGPKLHKNSGVTVILEKLKKAMGPLPRKMLLPGVSHVISEVP